MLDKFFPTLFFHDGGWFCLFTELLGSMLAGSHDFPKELSVMALIMEKKFSLSQWAFLLRSSIFLSSAIFEERHLVIIQLISYLLPEVAFKKLSEFRLVLRPFLQQTDSEMGICVPEVDWRVLWKQHLGGMREREGHRRRSWASMKLGSRARMAPQSGPVLRLGFYIAPSSHSPVIRCG